MGAATNVLPPPELLTGSRVDTPIDRFLTRINPANLYQWLPLDGAGSQAFTGFVSNPARINFVNLPFNYYGQFYTGFAIYRNGYIALCRQSEANGPSAMSTGLGTFTLPNNITVTARAIVCLSRTRCWFVSVLVGVLILFACCAVQIAPVPPTPYPLRPTSGHRLCCTLCSRVGWVGWVVVACSL